MADYSVVNPPNAASYAAPLLNFGQLAELPDRYYSAKEKQAQVAMREAFPNGIPLDAKGQPDVAKIMDIGAKTGGAQWVSPLLQMLIYSQAGENSGDFVGAVDKYVQGGGQPPGAPPPVGAAAPPPAAGPGGAAPAAAPPAAAPPAKPAVAPPQRQTERTTQDKGGGPPFAPMISRGEQTTQSAPATAAPAGASPPTVPAAGAAAAPSPPAQAAAAPAISTTGGGPAPAQAAPQQPQPGLQVPQLTDQTKHNGTPLAGLVPEGQTVQSFLDRHAAGMQMLTARAAALGRVNPAAAKALEHQADIYQKRTEPVLSALVEAGKLTEAQKNAIAAGLDNPIKYEAAKAAIETQAKNATMTEAQKNAAASSPAGAPMSPLTYSRKEKEQAADVAAFTKLYTGLQAMANTSASSLPQIQAARSLIAQPNFYSGIGQGANLFAKQVVAALGLAPDAALSQEAFGKQMAAFMLQQTNNLKAEATEMGGSSTRIFAQQIDTMTKASPSPEYTPAGNRYLVEVYDRAAKRAMEIADMAADYKSKHGNLDERFEVDMRKWMVANPMFSKEELKDPRLVAPVVVPALPEGATKADAQRALKDAGLSKGDPFKVEGDPQIRFVQ